GLSRPRLRLLASRVQAVHSLIEGASFIDTFRELHSTYDYGKKTAFTIATRVHRGGGLTKDAIYLRGLVQLLQYLRNNGRFDTLFLGKYNISHIPIINELKARQVIVPAPLTPRYFQDAGMNEKLQTVRDCSSPYELIRKGLRK
ncbi:MAG: tyrosine/phenylalanine carboxypeptidase domain-containing protein, partial [bacterium]